MEITVMYWKLLEGPVKISVSLTADREDDPDFPSILTLLGGKVSLIKGRFGGVLCGFFLSSDSQAEKEGEHAVDELKELIAYYRARGTPKDQKHSKL